MKSANVSELKSRLSSYLADVQRGEEIVVRDRNRPIARLVPLSAVGAEEVEEAALVAAGVLRLPLNEKLPAAFWKANRSSLTEKRAAAAVRLVPGLDRFHELEGNARGGVDLAVHWLGYGPLPDFQHAAISGGQNNGPDLVSAELLANGPPGSVNLGFEETMLDGRQQVIGPATSAS